MMQYTIDDDLDLAATTIPATRRATRKLSASKEKELIRLVREANDLGLEGDELLGYINEKKS